jgi:hypothetical protein
MQEIAALLLCNLLGQAGSADEIKAILAAAGLEVNEDTLTKVVGHAESHPCVVGFPPGPNSEHTCVHYFQCRARWMRLSSS